MVETGDNPKKIIESKGMKQQSDPKELEKMINEILERIKIKLININLEKINCLVFLLAKL